MERNYSFEALAEVTSTDWNEGRGELNRALKSIREQAEIEDDYLLADEIHTRAKMYRQVWPELTLTPNALAKHWLRVFEEADKKPAQLTNQSVDVACATCSNDRFVVVSLRKPVQTPWMKEHGFEPSDQMIEEMVPCPDCNADANTEMRRFDGTLVRSPDPARVREMMSR